MRVAADLASLYLVEWTPVRPDVIYTEAIPLRGSDGIARLFKGSVQLFHTGAHLRRHHDRRMPGGLLISVNGPGHYANALVVRGLYETLTDASTFVRRMAARSIGAGGLGSDDALSTTWHRDTCPADRDTARWFSAAYHLDVFVHGWFHGAAIADHAMHDNPWPPVIPVDAADFNY
ncbi:hypothetical protein SAMN05192558_101330 [Actinokineospora alba]|uniref:Uncharacterized protein n=1 Tax=Actinokineospora alba TaxID=504798 RepID=A0A1H0FDW4_9PSEU|nr:hypothetical protein [Actinokineospora alba]SDI16784.1 hypothetical protein SAMN05421871_103540 [Actinokineospora alba]SDN92756.1 hypothetical protein SAMN05192558_101330 [Actinokineospora alba]